MDPVLFWTRIMAALSLTAAVILLLRDEAGKAWLRRYWWLFAVMAGTAILPLANNVWVSVGFAVVSAIAFAAAVRDVMRKGELRPGNIRGKLALGLVVGGALLALVAVYAYVTGS